MIEIESDVVQNEKQKAVVEKYSRVITLALAGKSEEVNKLMEEITGLHTIRRHPINAKK
jgi:hypothetical protein